MVPSPPAELKYRYLDMGTFMKIGESRMITYLVPIGIIQISEKMIKIKIVGLLNRFNSTYKNIKCAVSDKLVIVCYTKFSNYQNFENNENSISSFLKIHVT